MADGVQVKKTVVKALCCVEKGLSFASSINPLFGIISPLVGLLRKGLQEEEAHPMEKEFQGLHSKIEGISAEIQQILQQIKIDEVNETFGKYEEYIKHQYTAFNDMVCSVKKDPGSADRHMEKFETVYERDEQDQSLDVYYRGVMGRGSIFSRPLLQVYLDHCDRDRTIMEHRCSHLRLLFDMGLITLMAYTAIIQDNEEAVTEKWSKRVQEIQAKMEEVLGQCKEVSPPVVSQIDGRCEEGN